MWIIVTTLPGETPMYCGPFKDEPDADQYMHDQLSAYDPHNEVHCISPPTHMGINPMVLCFTHGG